MPLRSRRAATMPPRRRTTPTPAATTSGAASARRRVKEDGARAAARTFTSVLRTCANPSRWARTTYRPGWQLREVVLPGAISDREGGRAAERRDHRAVHRRACLVEHDAVNRARQRRGDAHHRLPRQVVLTHLGRGHRRRQADHRHREEPDAKRDHGELHGTNDEPVPRGARRGGALHGRYEAALTLKLTLRVSTLLDVLSVTLISRR